MEVCIVVCFHTHGHNGLSAGRCQVIWTNAGIVVCETVVLEMSANLSRPQYVKIHCINLLHVKNVLLWQLELFVNIIRIPLVVCMWSRLFWVQDVIQYYRVPLAALMMFTSLRMFAGVLLIRTTTGRYNTIYIVTFVGCCWGPGHNNIQNVNALCLHYCR